MTLSQVQCKFGVCRLDEEMRAVFGAVEAQFAKIRIDRFRVEVERVELAGDPFVFVEADRCAECLSGKILNCWNRL